jgi:4a-hydroxytetrahydrobiopterin dehydratase
MKAMDNDEVAARLARELPHWRQDGRTIRRLYRVNGFKSALLATNAIGHLAEVAWHHPDIALSWGQVDVTLWSHHAGGVTERDFALAHRIEMVMGWRPDPPLEGTPADPQHGYITPDA